MQLDKLPFHVKDGVNHINGQKVPMMRKVMLTPAEALYDLALGRISPWQEDLSEKPSVRSATKKPVAPLEEEDG